MATTQLCSVKTSLKSRILQRRQESGLADITVDFSPKPDQPLTAEEVEKDKKRKASNRRSAMKSRVKMKEQDEQGRKLLKKEAARKKLLVDRVATLQDLKDNAISRMRTWGVPLPNIQAGLAATRNEWAILLQSTSETHQRQTRPTKPSSIPSSTYSIDSDTYSTTSDSINSSITSTPTHEFASSSFGHAPQVYSFGTEYSATIPTAFSSSADQVATVHTAGVDQVGTVHTAGEALVMEEDSLLKLDFELDPVSPATVADLVAERRHDCLFDDGAEEEESLGLECVGGSSGFVNAAQHSNRLHGFQIRQALMCM